MKPLLIDFDGVIKIGDEIATDAKDFFEFIDENKIPACILSNSTLRTSELMKDFLEEKGLKLKIPAFTAFDVTLEFVKKNYSKVKVYCRDCLLHHFEGMIDDENPEAVVIGDIGNRWNYDTMNEIFNSVMDGAEIIAMHKNKFWQPEGKLILDAGAFITAIEFATGKKATVIGKPSPLYFKIAVDNLGKNFENGFLMIGDDLENDVLAAQTIGGKGILVLTGKTKQSDIKDKKPDFVVNSLTDTKEVIEKIYIQ
ncbi:Putative HAD superfamily sugar phosphatase [Ignavibacterium album JCM 16511]|uniref:Putative HAD superfamily sugar phosphatase n=2 Tax=Ignavibacterium album TaxID=591197 RepID=I0AM01_IGNAJ|nr:Putative HAD superfamily sugar phosphatase [Ignavibacterium album JCM 16511]